MTGHARLLLLLAPSGSALLVGGAADHGGRAAVDRQGSRRLDAVAAGKLGWVTRTWWLAYTRHDAARRPCRGPVRPAAPVHAGPRRVRDRFRPLRRGADAGPAGCRAGAPGHRWRRDRAARHGRREPSTAGDARRGRSAWSARARSLAWPSGRSQGQRSQVFDFTAAVAGNGSAGSLAAELFIPSWRWIFYLGAPLAVLALLFVWAAAPQWPARQDRGSVDALGAGLFTAAIAGGLLALTTLGEQGAAPAQAATDSAASLLGHRSTPRSPSCAGSWQSVRFARARDPFLDLNAFRATASSPAPCWSACSPATAWPPR